MNAKGTFIRQPYRMMLYLAFLEVRGAHGKWWLDMVASFISRL